MANVKNGTSRRVSCFNVRLKEHSRSSHSRARCTRLVAVHGSLVGQPKQYWNSSSTRPVRSFTVNRVYFAVATHATVAYSTGLRSIDTHHPPTSTTEYLLTLRLPFHVYRGHEVFYAICRLRILAVETIQSFRVRTLLRRNYGQLPYESSGFNI